MKKVVWYLLFLFLSCGVTFVLINKGTVDATGTNNSEKQGEESRNTQTEIDSNLMAQNSLGSSRKEVASDKELKSTEQLNKKQTRQEEEQKYGVQLKTDGKEVAEQFQGESVEDYNWKAHWENEIFVIMSNAGTHFPLQKQKTECRKSTCEIKVWASVDRLDYINQTVGGINDAFNKAHLSLEPNKIVVEEGLLVFYTQPGAID